MYKSFTIYIVLFVFSTCSSLAQKEDLVTICLNKIPEKKGVVNTIYFNRMEITPIKPSERIIYKMLSEGSLTVTIMQGTSYQEPSAKDKNTRTITVEKGKTYYFEIDNKGRLEYIINKTKGRENFESSEYTSSPINIKEDINNPIPSLSVDRNIIRIKALAEKVKKDVKKREEEIKESIDEYFKELKRTAKLAEAVHPSVKVEIEEEQRLGGGGRYNIRATYTYDILEEELDPLQLELIHYAPGEYLLEKSAAALAIANAAKKTIDDYLYEFIEPGSKVNVQIVGSADASPIGRPIPYQQEFESLKVEKYYISTDYNIAYKTGFQEEEIEEGELESKGINTLVSSLNTNNMEVSKTKDKVTSSRNPFGNLQKGTFQREEDIHTNLSLAFLRSYGIRNFMNTKIEAMKRADSHYNHFAKVEKEKGGNFRKVAIEIFIEDILRDK